MSGVVLFALLPVLVFALVGAKLLKRRANGGGWTRVEGSITAARLFENDMGSVTQYCPAVDVSYAAAGQAWTAANLAVARETHADRAKVEALLAGPLQPGRTIALEFNTTAPGQVRVAAN